MKSPLKRLMLAGATVVSTATLSGGVALAQSATQMYQANLTALNGSGTTGTAMVEAVDSNTVKVTVNTTGASANLPHAQHIHIGGENVCPAPSADKDGDKLINTVEGQPAYGEIKVSLTTSGAVDADSGLAVDRFPKANADGVVSYSRTFDLPQGVSFNDLANGVVVQHGISKLFNDKTKYDGDKKSPLKAELPLEATIPAACGKLAAAPAGGVATGSGSTAGVENAQFAVVSAAALAVSTALLARRFTRVTE